MDEPSGGPASHPIMEVLTSASGQRLYLGEEDKCFATATSTGRRKQFSIELLMYGR